MTKSEYQALQDNKDIITNVYDWWCDYPVRIAITRITINHITVVPTNETKAIVDSEMWRDYNSTTIIGSPFKYIFYSERITTEGMFILYVEGGRTQQIHESVPNIWATSPYWKLIYENEEVKIYERVD